MRLTQIEKMLQDHEKRIQAFEEARKAYGGPNQEPKIVTEKEIAKIASTRKQLDESTKKLEKNMPPIATPSHAPKEKKDSDSPLGKNLGTRSKVGEDNIQGKRPVDADNQPAEDIQTPKVGGSQQ